MSAQGETMLDPDEAQKQRMTTFLARRRKTESLKDGEKPAAQAGADSPAPEQPAADKAGADAPGVAVGYGVNRGINEYRIHMVKTLLGKAITAALDDEKVIEVVLNYDGKLWSETLDGEWNQIGTMTFHEAAQLVNAVAGCYNRVVTEAEPIFDCQLPYKGERWGSTVPPIVEAPSFNIRKRSVRVIPLDDWVKSGALTAKGKEIILRHCAARSNILVIGGTGSGKTTFANAVLGGISQVSPMHRQIIIEDVLELRSSAPNREEWLAFDDEKRNMQRLVKHALRRRPDRIVIGEIRDHTAYDLCKAWNTGHSGGLSTVHANNCLDAFKRLEALTREHPGVGGAIDDTVREQLASAIQLLIWIDKVEDDRGRVFRKIREIREVKGYDPVARKYAMGESLL